MGGSLHVGPLYYRRMKSRMQAMAAATERVYELMKRAGAPDGMTFEEAVSAGLVSQEEVDAAFDDKPA
ncbi:MAG: hypothetical protein M3Q03_16875 [Chloroflexota bacterium]|nr:hypothetical protein [Chloroflexota bacterium]